MHSAGGSSHAATLSLSRAEREKLLAREVAPEFSKSFLSRWFFQWVQPLMSRGNKAALDLKDLWGLQPQDRSESLHHKWEDAWQNGGDTYSALKICFKKPFLQAGMFKLVNSTMQVFPSVALMWLLQFYEEYDTKAPADRDPLWTGYLYAGLLPFIYIFRSGFENHYFHGVMRIGFQARAMIAAAVFKKSLTLTPNARQKFTQGHMVNLMQLDAQKVEMAAGQGFVLFDGIYQIVLYVAVLIVYIGPSALAGLAAMAFVIPFQGMVMMKLGKYRRKSARFTDTRVKTENEALATIRAVKMYNWEAPVMEQVAKVRDQELGVIRSAALLTAANMSLMSAAPVLVAIAALFAFAADDGEFTASRVFSALTLFGQLRFPLMMYPWALRTYAEVRVSFKRLDDYLHSEDMPQQVLTNGGAGKDVSVKFTNAKLFWAPPTEAEDGDVGAKPTAGAGDSKQEEQAGEDADGESKSAAPAGPVLSDVHFEAQDGELVAVVGPVGSGKSSLAAALLGELYIGEGQVEVQGRVAYVAQTSWIQHMSLQDNILFGQKFDRARYQKVVSMCQLKPDLEVLPDGDQTIIGERGINLSGGQKARVSLARAVYADADVYILDDPLSALDAEVGKDVFNQCILEGLCNKLVILITNQLSVVPKCDKVVVLEQTSQRGGSMVDFGSYTDIMGRGMDFASMMQRFGLTELQAVAEDAESTTITEGTLMDPNPLERGRSRSRSRSRSASVAETKAPAEDLMQKEERETGAVPFAVYWKYITAGGRCTFFCALMAYITSQFFGLAAPYVVSLWTQDLDYQDHDMEFYMMLYAMAGIGTATFSFIRTLIVVVFGVRASTRMHDSLLGRILRAPLSFFDTTPTGRIVSRFSKDLDQLDNSLPRTLGFFIMFVVTLLGMLVAIISQTPWAAVAFVPWTIVYYKLSVYFRNVSRELKRLDSIARSPVYAQFSETLGGLSTIRAFRCSERFMQDHYFSVDVNHSCWFALRSTDRWLAIRVEGLSALILVVVAMLTVVAVDSGDLDASFAGFALSLALAIVGMLSFMVRILAELENAMNSAERVLHYSNTTPQEAAAVITDKSQGVIAPPAWPQQGAITFHNVFMKYRENTPLVLKGISLSIAGGEKIGIAGRSGCGKSSLLKCLFRLVEVEGSISIDGIDISKLGLSQLRSKLAIIPQDPPLLAGTVRSNLDPFNHHTDEELWTALERVRLKEVIQSGNIEGNKKLKEAQAAKNGPTKRGASKRPSRKKKQQGGQNGEGKGKEGEGEEEETVPTGLATVVAEHGENFSVGQRQLLCLARVLIRRCKILVLDEATSSVDMDSDDHIQTTIRQEFNDCTIIAIAHRLQTIVTADRILVLDDGNVTEFDSPHALLSNPSSALCQLATSTGLASAQQLSSMAQAASEARATASPSKVRVRGEINTDAGADAQ